MELDDLKPAWQSQTAIANETLLAITARATAVRRLTPLHLGLGLELFFNALAVLALGSYLGDHFAQPRLAIPAAIAGLFALVLCACVILQIVELRAIDRGASIVEMQRRLERLEMLRARTTIGTLAFAPLMWLPIAIVGADAFFGFDLYTLSRAWLIANVVFGVAVAAAAVIAARAVEASPSLSKRFEGLVRDLSGASLREAASVLAALRTFEREDA